MPLFQQQVQGAAPVRRNELLLDDEHIAELADDPPVARRQFSAFQQQERLGRQLRCVIGRVNRRADFSAGAAEFSGFNVIQRQLEIVFGRFTSNISLGDGENLLALARDLLERLRQYLADTIEATENSDEQENDS